MKIEKGDKDLTVCQGCGGRGYYATAFDGPAKCGECNGSGVVRL